MKQIEWTSNFMVYGYAVDGRYLYVGVDTMAKVYTFEKVANVPSWHEFAHDKPVSVVIFWSTPYKHLAQKHASDIMASLGYAPACNIDREAVRNAGRIYCNETSQSFANAADACRVLNIHPSALSMHLRGIPGHKTVKGYTFRRGM